MKRYWVGLLLLSIALFYGLSLRSGASWGDDWARYMSHALNLAHWRPYAQPAYVFNPWNPTYAPAIYPPGYPLLLTPVAAIAGLNLGAFKLLNLACFLLALWFIALYGKGKLSDAGRLVLVMVMGFAPWCWDLKDQILPDAPYLAASFGWLLLFEKWEGKDGLYPVLVLTVLAFGVCTLRMTGLALFGAYVTVLLLKKKAWKNAGLAMACFGLLSGLMSLSPWSDGSYGRMLASGYSAGNLATWLSNTHHLCKAYLADVRSFFLPWQPADFPILPLLLAGTVKWGGLGGILLRLKHKGFNLPEIYLAFYLLLILFYPGYQGFRYLFPLFPLLLFYLFSAMERLPWRMLRKGLAIFLTGLFCINSLCWYRYNFSREMPANVEAPETQELFRFLSENTEPQAVLIAAKPRLLSLYTGRPATVFPDWQHRDKLALWMDTCRVAYLVTGPWDNAGAYWPDTLLAHPERFQLAFENNRTKVYKVLR